MRRLRGVGILVIVFRLCVITEAAESSKALTLCKALQENPSSEALAQQLYAAAGTVADLNDRAAYATVYCLSRYAAGDTAAAAKTVAYLRREFPAHPYARFLAPALLSDICPQCQGEGSWRQTCTACDGNGLCAQCGGGGYASIMGFDGNPKACTRCRGSKKCPACNGSGETVGNCTLCRNGFVLSPAKARSVYLALLEALVSGTQEPDLNLKRSVSMRSILNAVDAAGQQYHQAGRPHRGSYLGQAREQLKASMADATLSLRGRIASAAANGAGQIQVRFDGFAELAEVKRSDKYLIVTPYLSAEVRGTMQDLSRLPDGTPVILAGAPEYRVESPGDAYFQLDCIPIATISIKREGYESHGHRIGTIVMRDYTLTANGQVFESPFQADVASPEAAAAQ